MMTTWVEEEKEKQALMEGLWAPHSPSPQPESTGGEQEGPSHPHLPSLEGSVEHCYSCVTQSLKRALGVLDPQPCLFLGAHQKLLSGGAQNEVCGRWQRILLRPISASAPDPFSDFARLVNTLCARAISE